MMAENALYPQTDPREKLDEALTEWKPWLKEQAEKKLKTQATRIQTFWHIGRNWPTQRYSSLLCCSALARVARDTLLPRA